MQIADTLKMWKVIEFRLCSSFGGEKGIVRLKNRNPKTKTVAPIPTGDQQISYSCTCKLANCYHL